MKSRHAAALALVGWYLMLPPMHQSGILFRLWYGHLADWTVVNSFDSAKECEDYRRQMIVVAGKAIPPPPPGFKVDAPSVFEYPPADARALSDGKVYSPTTNKIYESYPTALCIVSDDPRLAR